MTVPRSVADVLADHVTLEIESIDRMYCNLYVPGLQHVNGVVGFFRGHRGQPFSLGRSEAGIVLQCKVQLVAHMVSRALVGPWMWNRMEPSATVPSPGSMRRLD
jgi:hypothetical protein